MWVCVCIFFCVVFFFQAEDGIRDLVRSRGLGDVYKRQLPADGVAILNFDDPWVRKMEEKAKARIFFYGLSSEACLLYTSDAADDLLCVDLGGRRIIKKKKKKMKNKMKIQGYTKERITIKVDADQNGRTWH